MQQILILGGGAAGLAAALAAAQTAEGRAHITVLDKNVKVGKKLLATGNGRCNLDNRDITPERYFTSSPKALRRLLSASRNARRRFFMVVTPCIAIFKNSAYQNSIFAICSLRMLLVH